MINKILSSLSKEECKQINISLYGKNGKETRNIYKDLFKKNKIFFTFKDMTLGCKGFKDLNQEEKELCYRIRNAIYFDNKYGIVYREIKSLFKKKLYSKILRIAEDTFLNRFYSGSKTTKKSICSILNRIALYLGNEEESKKAKEILDYIKNDNRKVIFDIREFDKSCMADRIHPCIVKNELEYYKNIISAYKELKTIGWDKTINDIKKLSYKEIKNITINDRLIIERLNSGFHRLNNWYKKKKTKNLD